MAGVINVWCLTDNKPGHRNQLAGLCNQLQAHANVEISWIDAEDHPTRLIQAWPGKPLQNVSAPKPDIALAAGHSTHALLWRAKRAYGCLSCVLMKPTIPLAFFDAAIIPEHDRPPRRRSILATRGALNTVTPQTQPPIEHQGVILTGGESSHFHWDNAALVSQIQVLCDEAPDVKWLLTNSRRSPNAFWEALNAQCPPNLTLVHHTETPPGWVAEQLANSAHAWVTPDSVSMVYEAVTSGANVGLFNMAPKHEGRVFNGLQRLLADGLVSDFENRNQAHHKGSRAPLWEADRAAQWLLKLHSSRKSNIEQEPTP